MSESRKEALDDARSVVKGAIITMPRVDRICRALVECEEENAKMRDAVRSVIARCEADELGQDPRMSYCTPQIDKVDIEEWKGLI